MPLVLDHLMLNECLLMSDEYFMNEYLNVVNKKREL